MSAWLPQLCRKQLEKPVSFQQHSRGGASIIGVREEIGKETDENIKEHLRDAVPADYTRPQQEIRPQPLEAPHPRMSPLGLHVPPMHEMLNPNLPSLCSLYTLSSAVAASTINKWYQKNRPGSLGERNHKLRL